MGRTQELVRALIANSDLAANDLLLEALLRRGFLSFKEKDAIWLHRGSHPDDTKVLRSIPGLEVTEENTPADGIARLRITSRDIHSVAVSIVALPECRGGMTGVGLGIGVGHTWNEYRIMNWGARMPACSLQDRRGPLDAGIALLVKTMPIIRIGTNLSCDGHGKRPACVNVHFSWDQAWGQAVFAKLGFATPKTIWAWNGDKLTVAPSGNVKSVGYGYSDQALLDMLNDIQSVARSILGFDQSKIDHIGVARSISIGRFGDCGPPIEDFHREAVDQLNLALG